MVNSGKMDKQGGWNGKTYTISQSRIKDVLYLHEGDAENGYVEKIDSEAEYYIVDERENTIDHRKKIEYRIRRTTDGRDDGKSFWVDKVSPEALEEWGRLEQRQHREAAHAYHSQTKFTDAEFFPSPLSPDHQSQRLDIQGGGLYTPPTQSTPPTAVAGQVSNPSHAGITPTNASDGKPKPAPAPVRDAANLQYVAQSALAMLQVTEGRSKVSNSTAGGKRGNASGAKPRK